MRIKWLRIYKRYLNMSKGTALNAYNEMMHDYWIGAIPGVPRGRYGEVPPGASYGQLVAELKAPQLVAHLVDDEPEDPGQICDMWLSFWAVIFCVSLNVPQPKYSLSPSSRWNPKGRPLGWSPSVVRK